MAFGFGKKDKDTPNKAEDKNDNDVKSKGKDSKGGSFLVKKPSKSLSAVLNESVPSKVIDAAQNNKNFIYDKDGKDYFVGLLLYTAQIGGLTTNDQKDPRKGSFIQQMNSFQIVIYVQEDLYEQDALIIVPTDETVVNMSESSYLSDEQLQYAVVLMSVVNNELVYEKTEQTVTFAEIEAVSKGINTVDTFFVKSENKSLKDMSSDRALDPFDDDIPAQETETEDDGDGDYFYNDEFDVPDDEPPFISNSAIAKPSIIPPVTPTGSTVIGTVGNNDAPQAELPDDNDDYIPGEENDENPFLSGSNNGTGLAPTSLDSITNDVVAHSDDYLIPDEVVNATIIRRLALDKMELPVTDQEFIAAFVDQDKLVLLDEDRGEGWLNQYLNEFARSGNIEIQNLHAENLRQLRSKYIQLVQIHCNQLMQQYDFYSEGYEYNDRYMKLVKWKEELAPLIEKEVASRKANIVSEYESEREQFVNRASDEARIKYENRHKPALDEKIGRIKSDVVSEYNTRFETALNDLNQERVDAARQKLAEGIGMIIEQLSNLRNAQLEQERLLYTRLSSKMNDYLNAHREEDTARVKVLAKELTETDKAEKVRQELTSELERIQATFSANKDALESQLDLTKRNAEHTIKHNEETYRSQIDNLNDQLSSMMQKYADLDEQKKKEYEARMNEANDEKIAWQQRCEHIISVHKRSNIISVGLTVVAVIAAVAIGIIIGLRSNQNYDKANTEALSSDIMAHFDSTVSELVIANQSSDTEEDDEPSSRYNRYGYDDEDEDEDNYYSSRYSYYDDEDDEDSEDGEDGFGPYSSRTSSYSSSSSKYSSSKLNSSSSSLSRSSSSSSSISSSSRSSSVYSSSSSRVTSSRNTSSNTSSRNTSTRVNDEDDEDED